MAVTVASATTAADGQRLYDAGRFKDARQIWSTLAQANSGPDVADAQYGMGLLYDLGNGVAADPAEAYRWYLLAARAGLPAAEFNVAVMEDSGVGIKRDIAAAATWYARAAAHGHHRAEYNLAQLYIAGEGVPQNPDAAAAWLRMAASGHLVAAETALDQTTWSKRRGPSPISSHSLELQSAKPIVPASGEEMTESTSPFRTVEFVWNAPLQPVSVRFFVEVVRLDGDEKKVEMFARYVSSTACLVNLPAKPAVYQWRVYTVGEPNGMPDYAISDWRVFFQN